MIEIQVTNQIDDAEWDKFVVKHRFSQHEQTSAFARSRAHVYSIFRILLREEKEIIGGSQVFVLSTRLGNIAEIRHGPLFNEDNFDLVNKFVTELKKEAEKRNLIKIKVFSIGDNSFIEKTLQQLNFQLNEFRSPFGSTSLLNLKSSEDEIFLKIKRKTRYNIRFAIKKGVSVDNGDRTDITEFYELLKQTSELKNFPIFPIDYFYYLWDLYSSNGSIYFLVARSKDVPLAAMILIPYGTRLCRLWFGSARLKPDPKAGYLLDWEAILLAKKLGFHEYDFCGASRDASGYSEYKRNFGGDHYQYPDSLEYYFGMFPKLKRRITNIFWDVEIIRKIAKRYLYKNQSSLPF